MPTTYAIPNGRVAMNAITYTGAGAGTVITSGFYPDFAWMKNRTGAFSNFVQDSVRGGGSYLFTDDTAGDASVSPSSTFSSTGITINANSSYASNSSYNFVLWAWKAGAGTTSNITVSQYSSGVPSIASTVSANTTAGFSIVQFTATGATATIGHGLGVTPSMIIVKDAASAGNWAVWHTSLTSTAYYLFMNTTAKEANASAIWTGSPNSNTFGIGSWHTADRQIAYCFAAVAGYSAFGSYTGNGDPNGPFVYLGFRPRWLMIKRSSTASVTYGWQIYDTSRQPANTASSDPNLWADTAAQEGTGNYTFDLLSNGFKLRSSGVNENASGDTYIYAAFAENPFKYANAR
jgi:hypothetical protein